MKRAALGTLMLASLTLMVFTGCGDAGDAAAPNEGPPAPPPSNKQPVIEEPDLFKLVDTYLFVQNPSTGFNVISVADPRKPKLLGQAPSSAGTGAEMYIRDNLAIVLLKNSTGSCVVPQNLSQKGWAFDSELLIVDHGLKSHPKVVERYCVPGSLIASRTVDQVLYLVQANTEQSNVSQVLSFDIADPAQVKLVKQADLPDTGKEIKITKGAILVASRAKNLYTTVTYIEINSAGDMATRGSVELDGLPQGRFHMDVHGDQFRIVTYDEVKRRSLLHVLDISDPGHLKRLGQLSNIGQGEKLYATRFDGDRAYVVTYRQTDPLWVVDLSNPANPTIVGELHIPGWSDFIFPRGNKLLTVGRGNNGGSLGLSLFEVSNPSAPKVIDQIELGDPSTKSEANVDHRAVTILERPNQSPIVVVPHTAVSWQSGCQLLEILRLVEVQDTKLQPRGSLQQVGTIRRTFLVQSALFSISDEEVLSVNIADLDAPSVHEKISLGDGSTAQNPDASSYCNEWNNWDSSNNDYYYGHDDYSGGGYPFMWGCSVRGDGESSATPPVVMLLGLLWLGVWAVRRRNR